MTWEVRRGDCVEQMAAMPAGSVDAVVCDPPAGISFMSKAWDHHRGGMNPWVEWMADVLREALRVCKPGAHAFVWALPRTSHWTGSALGLAGWEVRDCVTHMFGSGFPKSHNLPNGRGTALKPAAEFWWLARKPLSGTVAGNVLEHGTGALNVDGCRVAGTKPVMVRTDTVVAPNAMAGESTGATSTGEVTSEGRWPPNVLLSHSPGCVRVGTRRVKGVQASAGHRTGWAEDDYEKGTGRTHAPDSEVDSWSCEPDCPVRLLDEQTGEQRAGKPSATGTGFGATGHFPIQNDAPNGYADSGGASRFFPTFEDTRFRYVAKAGRAERNAGLDGFEERVEGNAVEGFKDGSLHRVNVTRKDQGPSERKPAANGHPTVKPIELMRWLVRLVCPPGGTVLDPFCGSGSTGCAAVLEGFDFIGIEREPEYADIAEARIGWWFKHRGDGLAAAVLAAGEARDAVEATGQLELDW